MLLFPGLLVGSFEGFFAAGPVVPGDKVRNAALYLNNLLPELPGEVRIAALPRAISCSGLSDVTTLTRASRRAIRVVFSMKASAVWASFV